ncbi:L,D-transpeptidase [Rhizobium sp. PAMB 3182]
MRLSLAVVAGFLAAATCLSSPALAAENAVLQIIVSKQTQSLTVYENGKAVATSNVSTGKAGHTTPAGIFSILEKRKFHRSNLYDDAPMPFMQRITWSGVALHESNHVPRYPASHGCVRMPRAFAKELFGMTARGTHVIISEAPVAPAPISHPVLFNLDRPVQMLSDATLRPTVPLDGKAPVEIAMNGPVTGALPKPEFTASPLPDVAPLRILITWRSKADDTRDAQALLAELGYDIGPADGQIGRKTVDAVNQFKTAHQIGPQPELLSDAVLQALYDAAGRKVPPRGQLVARQNFTEVFSAPIAIRDPQTALGTHFLEVIGVDAANGAAEWNALTLPNHLPAKTMERLGLTKEADASAPDAAKRVLDRLTIPNDIRQKIAAMVVPGLSLTIADTGYEMNTGPGTDFVTTVRQPPATKGG